MSLRRLGALLATALTVAAAGQVVTPAADASTGYCAKGTGATVVVDTGSLGAGTSIGCDPRGANTPASTVVPRAGFPLTYVSGAAFVCKISGRPASANCGHTPPADAYWGLFWSDGKSGTWTYSSTGVGGLKVPAGGFIGWKWQDSSTRSAPGPAPVGPAGSAPKPTPTPSPKPTPKPPSPTHGTSPGTGAASGGTGSTATSSGPATSAARKAVRKAAHHQAAVRHLKQLKKKAAVAKVHASASAAASRSASAAAGSSPTATPSAAASTSDADLTSGEQASGSGPALPLVAGGLLAVLLGSAGVLAWRRRQG